MVSPFKFGCLLVLIALVSACSALRGPARTACPADYDLHVDTEMGFSACYPTGWVISRGQQPQSAITWVGFASPKADLKTGSELRLIMVKASPSVASPGEDFLTAAEELLRNIYGQKMLDSPSRIVVDGREAVEVTYIEEPGAFQGGVVKLTGWTAAFLAEGKQWVIEVVGRSGYRRELEGIHRQFLSHLHVLPPSQVSPG